MEKVFDFEPVTREQIKDYAEASGDHNKIHLDDAFAQQAGLPGVIAHGMLSMGLAARALNEWGYKQEKLGQFSAKFKDKVLPGDILQARLAAIKNIGEEKRLEVEIWNQKQDLVLSATASYKN
jgi:acyl dehydratase